MLKDKTISDDEPRTREEYQPVNLSPKKLRRSGIILAIYGFFALAIAGIQMFLLNMVFYVAYSPVLLMIALGVYTIFKTWHPVGWYRSGKISFILTAIDIVVCAFLVLSTGGLESPFLLYTLCPILRSALFLDNIITFIVVLISGIYVICSHLFNPFFTHPVGISWSYFIVYLTASCLSGALPYLINYNLGQRLQAENTIAERQRLSREIHDGSVQTLTALRWHAELLNRRLSRMGIDLEEAHNLLDLTEKSRQDALTTLELLRCNQPDADIITHIGESLKVLAPDIAAEYDTGTQEFHLEPPVEHELLRICQEAITNIKKHSRARHARVQIKAINSHLEVTIADDGTGFDARALQRNEFREGGHGLAVMKERAELVGGKFRVQSIPGKGTQIQVEVPTVSRLGGLWRI